jgi:hypothetical protein
MEPRSVQRSGSVRARRTWIRAGLVGAALASVAVLGMPAASAASPTVVSIGDLAVMEGDPGGYRNVKVPVTLSDPEGAVVTVSYVTVAGSASSPSDYVAKASGTVKIKAGKVAGAVPVKVYGDTDVEGDEYLTVTVTAVSGGLVIGRDTGTVTIFDDDPTSGPEWGVGDAAVVEGDSGPGRAVAVPVTLSAAQGTDVSVPFTVVGGSATVGVDYTAKASGTVTIKAGRLAGKVTVKVLGDLGFEGDEDLTVVLGTPTAGTVTRATGTVTILDDDSLPA